MSRRQGVSRRGLVIGIVLTLMGAAALALPGTAAAQKQPPITIVINQSPWFNGFKGAVEAYEKQTGNTVNLDVNPFEGLLEKQRNSVRDRQGQFDLLPLNSFFFPEFYTGGFVVPLNELDPSFRLDPQMARLDDALWWDATRKLVNRQTGKLMAVPINPNINLLYYRKDLYDQAGLTVPKTFDELFANAKKLHNPPSTYGIVQRGGRELSAVTFDFCTYLFGYGGGIFKDEKNGDFTVTINAPEAKTAFDFYLRLAKEAGHPQTGAQGQAQILQNLVTGKAAHVIMVIAAWASVDDPTRSAVVGKVEFAVPPPAGGHKAVPPMSGFLGAIPRNVPKERQVAALAFLKWFQTREAQVIYAKAGAPPVRLDVLNDPELNQQREFRWMKPLAEGLLTAKHLWMVPEGAQLMAVLDLHLNQAVTGEMTSTAALNKSAEEIYDIMKKAGYRTARLPDLK